MNYDEKMHWYECECGAKSMEEYHEGGTATYTKQAICSTCKQGYGEMKDGFVTVVSPQGETVYPYITAAKNYLVDSASGSVNVNQYIPNPKVNNPQQAINISWTCLDDSVNNFQVEYATNFDYSDAIIEEVEGAEISLYNLYKGTRYYVRITALDEDGNVLSTSRGRGTFVTTDVGPRVMKVDGIYNVRDLGGYMAASGKRTVQGLSYRGGALEPGNDYNPSLTENGAKYMGEVMGIKTQIDINGYTGPSKIVGAQSIGCSISSYSSCFSSTAKEYKDFFTLLAEKDNYPIYFNCTGGADRTGTAAFLLNACWACLRKYVFKITNLQAFPFTENAIQKRVYTARTISNPSLRN